MEERSATRFEFHRKEDPLVLEMKVGPALGTIGVALVSDQRHVGRGQGEDSIVYQEAFKGAFVLLALTVEEMGSGVEGFQETLETVPDVHLGLGTWDKRSGPLGLLALIIV